MADILERIRNPLLRATTAALMGASAVTIVAGGILGFTSLEKALIHRLSLYGGGAGAVLGALAGLAGVRPVAAKPTTQSTDRPDTGAKDTAAESGWQGWRSLVVKRKVQESAEITSFYLEPEDGQSLPGFVPGQFLTIKLDIPDQPRPVIRTYSLSDYAENPTYYRLSIKREAAPKDQDVPPGIASNFMHDRIQAGSVVAAKPPAGKFVLANVASDRPVFLISNGVGITPMISMAKAVQGVNPNRLVWFLHGARNGAYHAFRDSIVGLAQQTPGLTVHYRYSRPVPEDEGHYQDTGYVDVDLVKTCLGPDRAANDAEYYLCGSPAFMDSLRSGLAAAGVGGDRIFFESFSKPPKGPVAWGQWRLQPFLRRMASSKLASCLPKPARPPPGPLQTAPCWILPKPRDSTRPTAVGPAFASPACVA